MEVTQFHDLFGGKYKNKRVFVTGHTGFKGSWLVYWLTQMGADVTGYSLSTPTNPSHLELLHLNINSITGDILDKQKLTKAIQTVKPDIVFHLAAQALVRQSYLTPRETIETNIMGTANVLEAVRNSRDTQAVEIITSDKCYQNQEIARGYTENDRLGGIDPYSASKSCAEIVTNTYQNSFFNVKEFKKSHNTLVASVRAGNVIGGGDWAADRIVPDIVRAASKSETVRLRNPGAIRPWQHVLEPISGYLHLGSKLLAGQKQFASSWNFGPRKSSNLTVEQLVQLSKNTWSKVHYKFDIQKNAVHEAHILTLNSSKAQRELDWKPVWSGKTAIEKTIDWYKEYYENKNVVSQKNLQQYVFEASKKSFAWTR